MRSVNENKTKHVKWKDTAQCARLSWIWTFKVELQCQNRFDFRFPCLSLSLSYSSGTSELAKKYYCFGLSMKNQHLKHAFNDNIFSIIIFISSKCKYRCTLLVKIWSHKEYLVKRSWFRNMHTQSCKEREGESCRNRERDII